MADVADIRKGASLSSRDLSPGTVPVIGAGVATSRYAQHANRPPGTITISASGAHAGFVSSHFKPILATDCTTVICDPNQSLPSYTYYYLKNIQEHIYSLACGSAQPHIYPKDVASIWLLLPPLEEQRAIAEVLDSVDEAIERVEEIIVATERLRDALLHELLTRGLPGQHSEWKEVPGLGTIPASWKVTRLDDIVDILDSRRVPLNFEQRSGMSGIYPYYGANGIVDYINDYIFNEQIELILIAEDGGNFDQYRYKPVALRIKGKCWVNNHAHVILPRNHIQGSFIFHSLRHRDLRAYVSGSTRSKLTRLELCRIPMGWPEIAEQWAIAGVLDSVDEAIELAREELGALRSAQNSISDALLTGRVRVNSRREVSHETTGEG